MPKIEVNKIATLSGHKDCIYTLERAGTENLFFSAGGDGMVVLWDLDAPENGQLIAKVTSSVYALNYLADQNQLLVGHNFEGIQLIDLITRKVIASSKMTESALFDIQVWKDKILVACGDGAIAILSKNDLSTIAKIKLSDKSVRALAISEFLPYLIAAYSDNYIRVFSLENFKLLKEISAHSNSVFTVRFSPDGKYLLSGGRDAHLKVWDVAEDFSLKEDIVAHMYAINHIEYHPKYRYFATCSMDKSIKIWNADDFRLLKVIDKSRHAGHGTSVNKLLWSAYNDQLISASDDRTISIWNITI